MRLLVLTLVACGGTVHSLPSRDLVVEVQRRGGEPEDSLTVGLAAADCRFEPQPGYLPQRPRRCIAVGEAEMVHVRDLLVEHRFLGLRTRTLTQFSPHRGGWSVRARWPAGDHTVSDILMNEVVEADRAQFTGLLDALRQIKGVDVGPDGEAPR
jgi:hypothetical protein